MSVRFPSYSILFNIIMVQLLLVQFHILGPITLGSISYNIFYPGPITFVPNTCGPISYSWSKFHIPILLSFSIFLFLYFFILHITLLTMLIHFCSPFVPVGFMTSDLAWSPFSVVPSPGFGGPNSGLIILAWGVWPNRPFSYRLATLCDHLSTFLFFYFCFFISNLFSII